MDLDQAISDMYMQVMAPPVEQLPPINPAAFGGLPQQPMPQGQQPMPQGQQPMSSQEGMMAYVANKAAEIKQRLFNQQPSPVGALTQMVQQPMPQQRPTPQQPMPQQRPTQ
jgi:hypothetical protein